MKHFSACLLLLSSLLIHVPAQAQQLITAEQTVWTVPGVGGKSLVDASGNIWTRLNNTFRQYSPQGKLTWEKSISTLQVSDFGLDSLGNLYLSGRKAANTSVVAAEKYDQQQSLVWSKELPTPANGWATTSPIITVLPWDGIIVSSQAYQLKNSYPLNNVHVQLTSKGEEIDQASYTSYGYLSGAIDLQPPLQVGRKGIVISTNNVDKFLKGYGELTYFSGQLHRSGKWGYTAYPISPRIVFPTVPVYDTIRLMADQKQVLTDGKIISSVLLFKSSTPYASLPISYAYGVVKQDTTGKLVSLQLDTPSTKLVGNAISRMLDNTSSFLTINSSDNNDINIPPGPVTLTLNQFTSDLSLRSTQTLGTVTTYIEKPSVGLYLPTRELTIIKKFDDGSLLLAGATSGTMTIGGSTFTGANGNPSRFLIKISPNLLQLTAPATPICLGSAVALNVTGRYKGYFEQRPMLQLIESGGNFARPIAIATVPLSRTAALADTTALTTLLTPLTSLSVGVYQVRVVSQMPQYVGTPISLTVQTTPIAPTVALTGEELVATGTGSFQWYDGQNRPISGATDARYKPQAPGSYYATAVANGCASAPSTAVQYVITATEPPPVVQVYPNPTTDRLFVRWPLTTSATGRIRLIDAQGRFVSETVRTGDVTEVAIQSTEGILLVQLQADGQPIQVHKILVHRP